MKPDEAPAQDSTDHTSDPRADAATSTLANSSQTTKSARKKTIIISLLVASITFLVLGMSVFLYLQWRSVSILDDNYCSDANVAYIRRTHAKVGRYFNHCHQRAVLVKPANFTLHAVEFSTLSVNDWCLDVCTTQQNYELLLKDGQLYQNPQIPPQARLKGGDRDLGPERPDDSSAKIDRFVLYAENCPDRLLDTFGDDTVTGDVGEAYIDLEDLLTSGGGDFVDILAVRDITNAVLTTPTGLTCKYSAQNLGNGQSRLTSPVEVNLNQPACTTTKIPEYLRYCEFEKSLVTSPDYTICRNFRTAEFASLIFDNDIGRGQQRPHATSDLCLRYFQAKNPTPALCDDLSSSYQFSCRNNSGRL